MLWPPSQDMFSSRSLLLENDLVHLPILIDDARQVADENALLLTTPHGIAILNHRTTLNPPVKA